MPTNTTSTAGYQWAWCYLTTPNETWQIHFCWVREVSCPLQRTDFILINAHLWIPGGREKQISAETEQNLITSCYDNAQQNYRMLILEETFEKSYRANLSLWQMKKLRIFLRDKKIDLWSFKAKTILRNYFLN